MNLVNGPRDVFTATARSLACIPRAAQELVHWFEFALKVIRGRSQPVKLR